MTARSQEPSIRTEGYEKGQRLYCATCGAEVEIINPCTCDPPDQVLRCCGEPMRPSTGVAVNVGVES